MSDPIQPYNFGVQGPQGSKPFSFVAGVSPSGFPSGGIAPRPSMGSGQSGIGGQSLFGPQPTLGQNQPATGVNPAGQAQGTGQFRPTGLFGSTPASNPGQPGTMKFFTTSTQPSVAMGGAPSRMTGPSIFGGPSAQQGATHMSSSLGQGTTSQPQVLNLFSQFQPTATPANPQSSVVGANQSGFNIFPQSSGQPMGSSQTLTTTSSQPFPNPMQAHGGMQIGASSTQMLPTAASLFASSTQSQSASTTKTQFGQSSAPQPQIFPTTTQGQWMTSSAASRPFTTQQTQPFPTPQRSTLTAPSQSSQLPQMGQMFSTPQSHSVLASSLATPPTATALQNPQSFNTPQKQNLVTSSQAPLAAGQQQGNQFTPQNQNQFAPPRAQPDLPQMGLHLPPVSLSPAPLASQASGQPAIFQLQSSPSTAFSTSSITSSSLATTNLATLAPTLPPTATAPAPAAAPLSYPNPQTQSTLSTLQTQFKQPLAPVPTTSTKSITTITTTTSLPIVSSSTSGSVTQAPPKKYTYRQLEDVINQWVLELDEQQKVFVNQAKQINAWDVALLENEESIISLHNEVERAKSDQDRLNHDLDSILAQQSELEEMLHPLEGFLANQTVHASTQHADQERNKTYSMAEKIDTSMKDMMQNLREVMERINTVNSANSDRNNPISQITGILNAHMDSLLFIDDNTNTLQQKVDELSKKLDSKRQDQENKLKNAFN